MKFDYQLKRDLEEPTQKSIKIVRILGLFFVISGLFAFNKNRFEGVTLNSILTVIQVALGFFQIFFAKFASKRFFYQDEIVKIDNEKISWKLEKDKPITILKLNSIKKVELFTGEVHFETVSGDKYNLISHKIMNKSKFDKFHEIILKIKKDIDI